MIPSEKLTWSSSLLSQKMTGIGHISPLTFLLCIYVKTIKTGIFSSVYHFLSPLAFFCHISENLHNVNCRVPLAFILYPPSFSLNNCHPFKDDNRGLSLDTSSVVRSEQQPQTKSKTERKKGGNAGREAFKAPHKIKS